MENTLSFADVLKDIHAENLREKLQALETECGARKLSLSNPLTDVVYMTESELLLVKGDFLPPDKRVESWLADEESYNNEPPLYFSESSHRESPLYALRRAQTFYSRFFPEPPFSIRLLLLCNYSIINFDDMLPVWEELGATVVHNVTGEQFLFSEPAAPAHDTDDEPDDEEFDRLLEEFIAGCSEEEQKEEEKGEDSESVSEEDWDEDEPDEEDEPAAPVKEPVPNASSFEVETVKTCRIYPSGKGGKKEGMPLKTFALRHLERIEFCVDFFCLLEKKPADDYEVLLYSDTGRILSHRKLAAADRPEEPDGLIRLSLQTVWEPGEDWTWKKGKYLVEVRFHHLILHIASFTVADKDVEGVLYEWEVSLKKSDPFEELQHMVGLKGVKEQMERYRARVCLALNRKNKGLDTPLPSLHAAFMGSPGTGKTTVARLYGQMLKELGLLSKGHVVCEKRSTLLGQNYSSEQEKTLAALEKARGGVLFIDEAYLLYKPEDPKDPGKNVLETLLTEMGNGNDTDWALLLAGYTEEMNGLFTQNPGFDSRIPRQNRYVFEDYTVDELMQIADSYCEQNRYFLSPGARKALRNKVQRDYHLRDKSFGNGRYIKSLLTDDVLQSMSVRLRSIKEPSLIQLMTITQEDIPSLRVKDYTRPMKKLQSMVGLSQLKQNIERHLQMVRMQMLRNEQGIPSELPPLHMAFVGNPGTGKTTVADLIGEVYASLGILSVGHVVRVERKDLVGSRVGETEQKTAEVLKRAKGNVLFIDEAYTLYDESNPADFGRRAIESLLTVLARDHIDMLVVLAGYPEEMKALFRMNQGLASRIPYVFHFEDYTADELLEIARGVADRMHYHFTPAALASLRMLIESKMKAHGGTDWGNARFVTRLISNIVIPRMGERLLKLSPERLADKQTLLTIRKCDIPQPDNEAADVAEEFDEAAIEHALKRLDGMVGLNQVKQNVYNLVKVARHLRQTGRSYADCCSLRWNFVGHTGTGKSTVAGIIGDLLKAMHILEEGHLVEVKVEEFYNASEHKADEILKSAMIRSRQGLLFIDGDASVFARPDSRFNGEELRFKLSALMADLPGTYALVIAEHDSRTHRLTQSLRSTGLSDFNHTYYFEDYTPEELFQILGQCLTRKRLSLSAEAAAHLSAYLHKLCARRELGYANARTMKLIADSIAEICWQRAGAKKTPESRCVLLEDVQGFVWKDFPAEPRIGFK